MEQANFEAVLRRYLRGECPPAETRLVEHWYKNLDASACAELSPADQTRLKAVLWSRIQVDIQGSSQLPASGQEPGPVQLWRTAPLRWVAAALLVLGLGVGLLLLLQARQVPLATGRLISPGPATGRRASQWVMYANTTTQAVQLALADGSAVTLRPGSKLRYPRQFVGRRRDVYLQGEAFFKVARNPTRPFRVLTKQVVTTVLGTSFTVRAYPDQRQALVMVRTGRVRVSPRRTDGGGPTRRLAAPVELIPNQQVAYSPGVRELRKELVERPALLVPQPFTFDDRPVSEVIQALEHAYGVPIIYDEAVLTGCTVRLLFKDEPLFEKLDLLCKALGASYERAGEKIIFHSSGCRGRLRPPGIVPAGT